MYEYQCDVIRVVDGDTMHLAVDLGCSITLEMTVRLSGINAPEMRTPGGPVAKVAAAGWVFSDKTLTVHTVKDAKEKYGRYLAVLYREGDPQSLNAFMLANNYAVPFMTGPTS